jgi:flagellar biosynthesis chaperone FliJ
MTDTERDPAIEESVEQILNELEEIRKELRQITHELRVIEENYHTFRDRSVQTLLASLREDMDYLADERDEWYWEIEELLSGGRDDD